MGTEEGALGRDTVPVPRLDARIRNVGGKLLVAGPTQVLELDQTAVFVWKLIDGSRTIREIGQAVATEYDVDEETATADVAELVVELLGGEVVTLRET